MEIDPIDGVLGPATDVTLKDRRRPGRDADLNPALIPLLRGTGSASTVPVEPIDSPDRLAPARGVLLGVLLSVGIWAMVGVTLWFLYWSAASLIHRITG